MKIALFLSAVMIAAVLSGCVHEVSEIGTPGVVSQQGAPAAEGVSLSSSAPPEIMNWEYVSYRNLSISNAPALNQTARVTYSIVPDRGIEDLLVYISFLDGFEIVEVEGDRLLTRGKDKIPYSDLDRCARWRPTNLLEGERYQFAFTIKAVKTGNWTITGLDWEDRVYISVSEDSACIRDEPFPSPLRGRRINESEFESMYANMQADTQPTVPSDGSFITLPETVSPETFPPETFPFVYQWNGTAWVERKNQS